MKVAFRADSSHEIGSGHIHRCLVLAGELKALGWETEFVCRDFPGNMIKKIERDHKVSVLAPGAGAPPSDLRYGHWLGESQATDADQSATFMRNANLVVLDHYGTDQAWQLKIKQSCGTKLLVIDDLADRKHACDFLVDANYRSDPQAAYLAHMPAQCVTFFGPRYAFLREEFLRIQPDANSTKKVYDIVLFFGSMDPESATLRALEAYDNKKNLKIVAITTSSAPTLSAVTKLAAQKNIELMVNPADFAQVTASAEVAIGAGGISLWERSYLEVPSLVVSLADNQIPPSREMDEAGAIIYLGNHSHLKQQGWQLVWEEADALLKNASLKRSIEQRLRALMKPHLSVASEIHQLIGEKT